MNAKITAEVRKIVQGHIGLGQRVQSPDQRLQDDFNFNDLDVLEVVMACEDKWPGRVYITDEEAEAIRTVGDLERIVATHFEATA